MLILGKVEFKDVEIQVFCCCCLFPSHFIQNFKFAFWINKYCTKQCKNGYRFLSPAPPAGSNHCTFGLAQEVKCLVENLCISSGSIQLGWESMWDLEVTRLGKRIIFGGGLGEGDDAWSKSLPQRKRFLECSQIFFCPQKWHLFKEKKYDKISIPWVPPLPTPVQPQKDWTPGWGSVAGQPAQMRSATLRGVSSMEVL